MSTVNDYINALERIVVNDAVYSAIIKGPASGPSSIVVVDGQPIKTVARVISEVPSAEADRIAADASAALAAAKAVAASVDADAAQAAKASATLARDAAQAYAQVYDSVAVGRAAVADGAFFKVRPNGTDGLVRLTLYKRTSSTTQDLVDDWVGRNEQAPAAREAGGMFRFLWRSAPGAATRLLAYFDELTGAFVPTRFKAPAQSIDLAALTDAVTTRLLATNALGAAIAELPREVQSGLRWVLNGRIGMTLDEVKGLYPRRLTIPADAKLDDNPDATLAARLNAGGQMALSNLAFWGDSFMTVGAGGDPYPQQVATAMARTYNNGGIGGQTSPQIIARQGAKCARLTVSGNSIPASGPVSVTSISNLVLSTPSTTSATRTLVGALAGIPGTLTCVESASGDSSDTYTFTRTNAGSAVFCAPDTPFVPDTQYRSWTSIIGIGRNNVGDLTGILADTAAAVSCLTHDHYLIVGVTNGSTEASGSAGYNNVVALNRALAEIYGDRFIDIRGYLINRGLADAGLTPTSQDNTDLASDIVPTSLRSDTLHLNAVANPLIKNLVVNRLNYKGF